MFVKYQRRSTDLIVALANRLIQDRHKGLSVIIKCLGTLFAVSAITPSKFHIYQEGQ